MSKKIIALVLAALMMFALVACGGTEDTSTDPSDDAQVNAAVDSDLAYVQEKGTLVVAITDFEPMDYQDKDTGEWIGFDADLAKKFAESLGVKAEFSLITWSNKIFELDGKSVDCVWNGMTLTEEVTSAMSCSKAYCNNAQIVIVPADKADQYKTAEDCKDLSFAVEQGSAGKDACEENGFKYVEVEDQATAVQEVASGTADAAIIDSLMAGAMVGEGTGFENLTYTVELTEEEYGVGFRKGSDLTAAFDAFLDAAIADGTVEEIAEQYGVQAAIIK